MTARNVGDAARAVEYGRRAAESCPCPCQGTAFAHSTVGYGLLLADRPDPAAAVHAGLTALISTSATPNAIVVRRAQTLHCALAATWLALAEVTWLGDALRAR